MQEGAEGEGQESSPQEQLGWAGRLDAPAPLGLVALAWRRAWGRAPFFSMQRAWRSASSWAWSPGSPQPWAPAFLAFPGGGG